MKEKKKRKRKRKEIEKKIIIQIPLNEDVSNNFKKIKVFKVSLIQHFTVHSLYNMRSSYIFWSHFLVWDPKSYSRNPQSLPTEILRSQAQWFTPVIQALWEADYLRSGVQDQPGQHGATLSLLKTQKLSGSGVKHLLFQLLQRLKQENPLNLGGGGCS